MDVSIDNFLTDGIDEILGTVNALNMPLPEKQKMIEAYTESLLNVVSKSEIENPLEVICKSRISYVDDYLYKASKKSISDDDCIAIGNLCDELISLMDMCTENEWRTPKVKSDYLKIKSQITNRLEDLSKVSYVIATKRDLIIASGKVSAQSNVDTIDNLLMKLNALAELIKDLVEKKVNLPSGIMGEIIKAKERLENVRVQVISKEQLLSTIQNNDNQLYELLSKKNLSKEQWSEVVLLCHKQNECITTCNQRGIVLPGLKINTSLGAIEVYSVYIKMLEYDNSISEEEQKEYKDYQYLSDLYSKQYEAFKYCKSKKCRIPELANPDIKRKMKAYKKLSFKNRAIYKIRKFFIRAGITCAVILLIIATGLVIFHSNNKKMPISRNQALGADVNDIASQLKKAGFKNICMNSYKEGWQRDGTVKNIKVDGNDYFALNEYYSKNVKIEIQYFEESRIEISSILEGYQNKDYKTLEWELLSVGLKNITLSKEKTQEKEKNYEVFGMSVCGLEYQSGECWVLPNEDVEIHYYVYAIPIGKNNYQFKNNKYEDVCDELRELGFTNVKPQEDKAGFKEGGNVLSVSLNGSTGYEVSDLFEPSTEIVVRYSSEKRKDLSDLLKNLGKEKKEEIEKRLTKKDCKNIEVMEEATKDLSLRGKVKLFIDGEEWNNSTPCYVDPQMEGVVKIYLVYVEMPGSNTFYENRNYIDVGDELSALGFTNIQYESIVPKFGERKKKDKQVYHISIDGKNTFENGSSFSYDSQVIITVNVKNNLLPYERID